MQGMMKKIPIELLVPNPFQPRLVFAKNELQELAESIKSTGLLQPILVRKLGSQSKYEIIAGERRWRALQWLGLMEVTCIVCDYNDQQIAEAAIIENIHRVDLNPIEEARAYQRLINEFALEHQAIADVVGKSRQKISNLLRLLKLDKQIQEMIMEGIFSEGHAKALLSAPLSYQLKLAHRCVAEQWSVRRLEQEIRKCQHTRAVPSRSTDTVWLEQQLSEYLKTPVSIAWQPGRGKLTIDFFSLAGLDGILQQMGYTTDTVTES